MNPFHDHLDVCEQCRNHPMALCGSGMRLLADAAAVSAGAAPEPAQPQYGANFNAQILVVHHAALKRWSPESEYKVVCPACGDGILLVQRDRQTLHLLNVDRCIRCAQLVRYRDEAIGGEPVVAPPETADDDVILLRCSECGAMSEPGDSTEETCTHDCPARERDPQPKAVLAISCPSCGK